MINSNNLLALNSVIRGLLCSIFNFKVCLFGDTSLKEIILNLFHNNGVESAKMLKLSGNLKWFRNV